MSEHVQLDKINRRWKEIVDLVEDIHMITSYNDSHIEYHSTKGGGGVVLAFAHLDFYLIPLIYCYSGCFLLFIAI